MGTHRKIVIENCTILDKTKRIWRGHPQNDGCFVRPQCACVLGLFKAATCSFKFILISSILSLHCWYVCYSLTAGFKSQLKKDGWMWSTPQFRTLLFILAMPNLLLRGINPSSHKRHQSMLVDCLRQIYRHQCEHNNKIPKMAIINLSKRIDIDFLNFLLRLQWPMRHHWFR